MSDKGKTGTPGRHRTTNTEGTVDKWYVAKTKHAETAEENLTKQGYVAWLPRVVGTRVLRGRILRTTTLLFGPYILVQLDMAGRWQPVNNTKGVERLLPLHCEAPVPLASGEVELWRQREADGEFTLSAVEQATLGYQIGDAVPVIEGPWMGHTGYLAKPESGDGGGLPLLLALFSRQVRVLVTPSSVEPAPLRGAAAPVNKAHSRDRGVR